MFLNVKLQRLCQSHHLQCIKSSKDSERLEKSLCVRDKAEDLCWMPVVFRLSDSTVSLIGMILSLTLLNREYRVLRAKEEGDLPACYQHLVQKPASLMVWGFVSAYGMDSLHVLEGTMNAEKYIKVLEQHMLPSRWHLFQGRPCVFQQDNAKPHTPAITTAWLRSRRFQVLNWPACIPDLSPIENIWCIIKQKICQRRPRTLQQLETHIRQEWDQIPTLKLQKLITSMPRCLQHNFKRRGDSAPW